VADFEANVPERADKTSELLVERLAMRFDEDQDIDIGVGVEFFATIAPHGDEGGAVGKIERSPELGQDAVDEAAVVENEPLRSRRGDIRGLELGSA
jgi:hypothetical protein